MCFGVLTLLCIAVCTISWPSIRTRLSSSALLHTGMVIPFLGSKSLCLDTIQQAKLYTLPGGRLLPLSKWNISNRQWLNKNSHAGENYIRRVSLGEPTPTTEMLLPHFPVVRADRSTTKRKIVFDASAKFREWVWTVNHCWDRNCRQTCLVFLPDFERNSLPLWVA